MRPLFSIIVPLYNSAQALPDALSSIDSQSIKDFELIFVDGASTDDTLAIVKEFCNNCGQQHIVISEPDKGIYDALNKGLKVANGQWLYFMGGDDRLYSEDVLKQISIVINDSNADLIHGNVTGIISGKRYVSDNRQRVFTDGLHHQGVFFKRAIFDYTGSYDTNFKVAADYHLMLKVFVNPAFITQYVDATIALFGECGLSSTSYDYRFYSYYYRFLYITHSIKELGDNSGIFNNSVNCCYELARINEGTLYAWSNLLFYVFNNNHLKSKQKLMAIKRMIYWTGKFQISFGSDNK